MALLHLLLVSLAIVFVLSDSPPFCDDGYPLIIVGSGLAGHSAAAEAISILSSMDALKSHPIVVFEKEAKYGGNSMKATSGINGADTEFQSDAHIADNVNDFGKDTYYSSIGGKENDQQNNEDINILIQTLTSSSSEAVNWLKNEFDLKLTAISQCGGHSHARTHRPPAGPAGNIIVKTIHKKIENNVQWNYNCEVTEILFDSEMRSITGIKYKDNNENGIVKEFYGMAVILTSGGFGNDHSETSLLKNYGKNKEWELPTTNGDWATGDGVKMGQAIGGQLIDMSEIQIHPTGFINPKSPNDKTKFLAPEALRGLGGIMINNQGKRFVNELDLRAKVVEQMRLESENTPFRLLMNDAVKTAFGPNMGFYLKFGLVKEYENIQTLADEMEISVEVLKNTIDGYVKSAKEGSDEYGKEVFPNGDTFNVEDTIYAALVTPVIHYTMGGLSINEKAEIMDVHDHVMRGFYGAGEVTGGVHGKNRLAGNSLLECVVYGRIAARNAIQYCENVKAEKKLHHDEL